LQGVGFWHGHQFKSIKNIQMIQNNQTDFYVNVITVVLLQCFCGSFAWLFVKILLCLTLDWGKIEKIFKATFGRNLTSQAHLSSLFPGPGREKCWILVFVVHVSGHSMSSFCLNFQKCTRWCSQNSGSSSINPLLLLTNLMLYSVYMHTGLIIDCRFGLRASHSDTVAWDLSSPPRSLPWVEK
jgi:hypothetical protein